MENSNAEMLVNYRSQLTAVENALICAPAEQKDDLIQLKSNLLEVLQLLESPEEQGKSNTNYPPHTAESSNEMDAEFARFQMEMSELGGSLKSSGADCDIMQVTEEDENDDHELFKVISSLEGTKCSASFSQQWGEKCYHNAIISSVDFDPSELSSLENLQVKVMFLNPICDDMKPCPFFLDGHCKFSDEKCRYSHGNKVNISEIRDFKLPDFSNFMRDSLCLAKYSDGLWYKALVENCLDDNKYVVKYSNFGNTEKLDAVDLLPLGESCDDFSENETEDSSPVVDFSAIDQLEENTEEIRTFFPKSSGPLGEWEQHTKGMGSKLMAKMGYVTGQGLGKNGEGRLEPVEAIILPKGKSLDKCIELRDQGGRQCPISVENKVILEKERTEQKMKRQRWSEKSNSRTSIFDFINKKIAVIKDDFHKLETKGALKHQKTRASCKDLNKESFAVAEEIKKGKRELQRLHNSLKRNEERNGVICAQLKRKVEAQKELLTSLCTKEHKINREMKVLKTHEKLTNF